LNVLKLKIATPEYVVYFYYPEDKGEPGEIRMNIPEEETIVVSHASGDNSAGHYAFKAAGAIKECVSKTQNIPIKFTNAWY